MVGKAGPTGNFSKAGYGFWALLHLRRRSKDKARLERFAPAACRTRRTGSPHLQAEVKQPFVPDPTPSTCHAPAGGVARFIDRVAVAFLCHLGFLSSVPSHSSLASVPCVATHPAPSSAVIGPRLRTARHCLRLGAGKIPARCRARGQSFSAVAPQPGMNGHRHGTGNSSRSYTCAQSRPTRSRSNPSSGPELKSSSPSFLSI